MSANHFIFHQLRSGFAAFDWIARWYLWPAIKDRAPEAALTPLLLYACLRVNGLMFLMPGLVSPDLPNAFAVPTAYGDLTSVVLALLALAACDPGAPSRRRLSGSLTSSGFSTLPTRTSPRSKTASIRSSSAVRTIWRDQCTGHAGRSHRHLCLSACAGAQRMGSLGQPLRRPRRRRP